jgi:hypothetical protein
MYNLSVYFIQCKFSNDGESASVDGIDLVDQVLEAFPSLEVGYFGVLANLHILEVSMCLLEQFHVFSEVRLKLCIFFLDGMEDLDFLLVLCSFPLRRLDLSYMVIRLL